jgi:hypothetical protein
VKLIGVVERGNRGRMRGGEVDGFGRGGSIVRGYGVMERFVGDVGRVFVFLVGLGWGWRICG